VIRIANHFLLVTDRTRPEISPKFVNKFLSYPANRQTDKRRLKHFLSSLAEDTLSRSGARR